jgi:hypothetical protein
MLDLLLPTVGGHRRAPDLLVTEGRTVLPVHARMCDTGTERD